jgi:hypothetical protein
MLITKTLVQKILQYFIKMLTTLKTMLTKKCSQHFQKMLMKKMSTTAQKIINKKVKCVGICGI